MGLKIRRMAGVARALPGDDGAKVNRSAMKQPGGREQAFMKRGRCLFASVLIAGLIAGLAVDLRQAQAGQARAQFNASIRIDPELVRRDLQRRSTLPARSTRATTAATSLARVRRTLPLAGGGACTRAYYTATRFRWICR